MFEERENEEHCNTSNRAVLAFGYFCISIICILFTYIFQNQENAFLELGICLVFELIAYIYVNKKITGTFLNFAAIFICVLFLFHFGQVVLLAFFREAITTHHLRIVLLYFEEEACVSGLRVMNIAFVGISLGTIMQLKKPRSFVQYKNDIKQDKTEKPLEIKDKNAQKLAMLIILITFPIKMVIDILLVYKSFTQGFANASAWLQAFPNFVRSIGSISIIGFALLIVALRCSPKKQMIVFCGVIAYLGVIMLSGWRSESVAYLIIIALLYISSRQKKLTFAKIVLYVGLLYLLLCLLYAVVSVRFNEDRNLGAYLKAFQRVLLGDKNIILETLREFGNTGYTALCVLINWLENFDPSWGESYFFGITAILPNLTGLAGKLTEEGHFALQLQNQNMVLDSYYNIGGSILGEFFFNFGIFGGIIFSLIVGYLIGWISRNVQKYLKSDSVLGIVYYIPAMFGILYWTRDVFGSGIRDVVWGILFCYILIQVLKLQNANPKRR